MAWTTSCLRDQHTEMPYSLVLHQSCCCEVKYSEKQIGFSHENLYNLHLLSNYSSAKTWLSTRNRISSPTSIDTTFESKEPRFRLLEIEANAVIHIHLKFSNELGFWRREPRLVTYAKYGWSRTRSTASQQLRGGLKYDGQAKIAGFLVGENHRKSHKRIYILGIAVSLGYYSCRFPSEKYIVRRLFLAIMSAFNCRPCGLSQEFTLKGPH